jgi:hypothetical protein
MFFYFRITITRRYKLIWLELLSQVCRISFLVVSNLAVVAKLRGGCVNVEAGPRGLRLEDFEYRDVKTDNLAWIYKFEIVFFIIEKKLQLIRKSELKRIGV